MTTCEVCGMPLSEHARSVNSCPNCVQIAKAKKPKKTTKKKASKKKKDS